jgi:hypothetical protein
MESETTATTAAAAAATTTATTTTTTTTTAERKRNAMKRNAYPSLQGNRIQEEHSLSLSHTHKHMPENCSSLSSFLSLPPLLSLSVYVPHFFDNLSAYILWNVDGTRRDIRMRVNQNPSIKIPSEMNNQTNC